MFTKSRRDASGKVTLQTLPVQQHFHQLSLMASNNTHNEPHTPRPTRMVTRAKNATVHPGALLRDAQRSRRTREEIAEEKELKNLQTEAKQRKKFADKARKARGRASIQQLEKIEAAATANAEHEFPRHRGFLPWNMCVQLLMSI